MDAGLCKNVEDYDFSTLKIKLGLANLRFPMAEDTTLISGPANTLKWLNTAIDPNKKEILKFCFRHQYFQSRLHGKTKKPIISQNDLV